MATGQDSLQALEMWLVQGRLNSFYFSLIVTCVAIEIILENTGPAGALLPPPSEGPLRCYLAYETFPDPTAWKVFLFSLAYHSNLLHTEKLDEVMSACKLKINLIKTSFILPYKVDLEFLS